MSRQHNHNQMPQSREGAILRFERPPTRAEILRSNVGKAAANSFAMRLAELRDTQLQVLKQEEGSYSDPVTKKDIIQNNYDLAG